MNELAITVIGEDRVGIVADLTGVLAELGANLTDSTMTRLRGHFAMTLICTADLSLAEVQSALDGLAGLTITVAEVAAEPAHAPTGGTYLLNVHGADRLGIVAAVTRAVAGHGGNITDLTTRLTGPLYVVMTGLVPGTGDPIEITTDAFEALRCNTRSITVTACCSSTGSAAHTPCIRARCISLPRSCALCPAIPLGAGQLKPQPDAPGILVHLSSSPVWR